MDVRTVTLQGHALVYSQLQRANGAMEYALTFSAKEEGNLQRVYSLWNLDEYPKGDYLNFQVWGSTMGQVTTTVNHILKTLDADKKLVPHKGKNILPTVFIKNGYYKNGKLHLNVINKASATWMNIDGNYKETEQATEQNLNTMITLNGDWEQEVVIDSGHLFDIGISILAENSYQHDALYLADGPWGADFNTAVDASAEFNINEHSESPEIDSYAIERNITAKGEVKETINIFRNVLAGDLRLDVTDYNFLQLHIKNDRPIEVSLVTDATDQWEERLRLTLAPNSEKAPKSLAFKDFKNHENKAVLFTQLKSIVFSVQGDYQNYKAFALELEELALTKNGYTEEEEQEVAAAEEEEYPVPMSEMVETAPSFEDAAIENVRLTHYQLVSTSRPFVCRRND